MKDCNKSSTSLLHILDNNMLRPSFLHQDDRPKKEASQRRLGANLS